MLKSRGRSSEHLCKNPRFFDGCQSLFGRFNLAVFLSPLLDIPIPPVYHHARLVAVWGQRPVLVFFGPRTKCWFGDKTLRRP
jgi:hypothetical protein